MKDILKYLLLTNADSLEAVEFEEGERAYDFWKCHRLDMPGLALFARYAFTFDPSSAPVERDFSILTNSLNERQREILEDYCFATVALQYNKKSIE